MIKFFKALFLFILLILISFGASFIIHKSFNIPITDYSLGFIAGRVLFLMIISTFIISLISIIIFKIFGLPENRYYDFAKSNAKAGVYFLIFVAILIIVRLVLK